MEFWQVKKKKNPNGIDQLAGDSAQSFSSTLQAQEGLMLQLESKDS